MQEAEIKFKQEKNKFIIKSIGYWKHSNLTKIIDKILQTSQNIKKIDILWDFKNVIEFDSAGIMLVIRAIYNFRKQGCSITIINLKDEHKRLLIFYRKNFSPRLEIEKNRDSIFYKIGKSTINYFKSFFEFISFVGENAHFMLYTLLHPLQFRFKATIKHIDTSGVKALPIIALTAFLIGVVIAYQASTQLAKFGANIFIVEMVSISVFRELAPLITAIVIAGRSASSYTAEIGTMKITEEIDAMRTMGFNPHLFLVLPRLFALFIAMPLLVFFADVIGLIGGMVVANFALDITYHEFINRMQSEVPIKHLLIGLIKAPFFGIIIALIGSFRGFQVTKSTDSIGKYTTISVVNAIFWVIACDAIFSVILTEIGI